ncbi:MAG: DUF433 domain-containing protein [Alphaproteobacteria bacterium]|nr:DUF433 domain-containing protein [Alphaproteobacteria bacterium]
MREATATDLRDNPAYTIAEAARYLKLAPATLRSWVLGRRYPTAGGNGHFRPLIGLASRQPPLLSFWNLIEAHVLRSLRTEHVVPVRALRPALAYAEKRLHVRRLLLRKELCTDAGQVFLERYGQLINLSASGQLAMRHVFSAYLKRVEWDEWMFPVRLYPFVSAGTLTQDRPIVIDPQISFGRPVVIRMGISTAAIAGRVDAGEAVNDIAEDYDLTQEEVEQAVLYERVA